MKVNIIHNHADYRLCSNRVLNALAEFGEVNLFLRGIIPTIGFSKDVVYYDRLERFAGEALDVLVNGMLIAHGEVVVINDKFGIRLTDVISQIERIKKLR